MRKFLLVFVFILSLCGGIFDAGIASAQDKKPNGKMMKEIQEYKIKFLAQEMELKDNQKKEFADIYVKYDDERMKNFRDIRQLEKKLNSNSKEQEYKEINDKLASSRLRDVELEKEYNEKFSKVLTPKQIYKMKDAEEKFRRKMMDMRHKHKSGDKRKAKEK